MQRMRTPAVRANAKHFRVVPKAQYFRLTHVPSGDYIQRYLYDFLTRKDALACRDRMINAAPDWDWSHPGLLAETPTEMFHKIWDAIYEKKAGA